MTNTVASVNRPSADHGHSVFAHPRPDLPTARLRLKYHRQIVNTNKQGSLRLNLYLKPWTVGLLRQIE